LSGEGAARFGGRWNPLGVPTIYAACELSTAWAEYNQGFVQHPALIAQLHLTGAYLPDLTVATVLREFGLEESIHQIQWRSDLDSGVVPATHTAYKRLVDAGADGVVYPSFMSPGGTCVALWRWNRPGQPKLEVLDPDGRMPKSPASWEPAKE
jgi:RES domain-containing protein